MARTYEDMIGRAVTDPDFRKRLLTDPETTIRVEGYEVSAEVLQQIKAIDPEAAEAAAREIDHAVGNRMAAS